MINDFECLYNTLQKTVNTDSPSVGNCAFVSSNVGITSEIGNSASAGNERICFAKPTLSPYNVFKPKRITVGYMF